jgi:hypothetical protein
MNATMKTFEVVFGRATAPVRCGPYFAASIDEIVRGLESGQRITLERVTANVYETNCGQRFTITEIA